MCQRFYLFEPICTAILLACCSFVHVLRVYAIHDQNRKVLGVMSALLAVQIVVNGICCGFYRCERLSPSRHCTRRSELELIMISVLISCPA